jgi:hypothetical protein
VRQFARWQLKTELPRLEALDEINIRLNAKLLSLMRSAKFKSGAGTSRSVLVVLR